MWSKWQHTPRQSPWQSVHIEYGTFLFDKTYVACKHRLQFCLKFYEIPCEPEPLSGMEYTSCVASGKLNYTMILCTYNICTETSITVSFPWIIKSQTFEVKSRARSHARTHAHAPQSTESRNRLTLNCTHTSKYTSLWTCVLSPHNMSSLTHRPNKYCLPSSCSRTPSFDTEFSGSCPLYLQFIWLFPL